MLPVKLLFIVQSLYHNRTKKQGLIIVLALIPMKYTAITRVFCIASEVPNAKALTTTSVKSDLRFLLRIASKLITITGTSEKADAHYIHLASASNYSIPPPVLTLSIKSSLTRIRITVKILPPPHRK